MVGCSLLGFILACAERGGCWGFLGILNGKLIEVIGRTVGGWLSLRMILFSFFLTKGSLELSYHGHLCMVNPFMLACVRRALPPPLSLEDLHPRGLHRQGSASASAVVHLGRHETCERTAAPSARTSDRAGQRGTQPWDR